MARNWESLSDSYRTRLQRSGITKSQYESGTSLASARGHSQTPEHPERAESNQQRYQQYLSNRNQLVTDIQRIKRELFGDSHKWSNTGSRRNIRVDPETGKVRTIQELRAILNAGKEARQHGRQDAWYYILEEHEDYASAFWYH